MCIPESPKTKTIKSEAPFITLGCSIKSSVELTNPVSFTQDLTFERSLPQAFLTWDIMFRPQRLAASYPSSVFKSLPILPLINSPFAAIEICPEIK